jgi:aspartate carbamoyltransferase catalytic subunit
MPDSHLSTRHLLGIKDLSEGDVAQIFRTAREFRVVLDRPIKKVPALRETTIANVFFESSTRTRLSFELAAKRLSADVLSFAAAASSVSKGETLVDTVQNILAMKVDMVVLRHPAVGAPHFLTRHIDASVINAGDGTHEHPTQALLDSFSLHERFGRNDARLTGLKVAIVGDILHSRVALSNIFCLQLLGAQVRVCGPPTLIPTHEASLGVEVSHDLDDTLRWADAVNMLRVQHERMDVSYFPSLREYSRYYGLTRARIEALGKPLTILHPGPINRGVEITSDVADSPDAIILEQVLNGVAIRMAVLYLLAGAAN